MRARSLAGARLLIGLLLGGITAVCGALFLAGAVFALAVPPWRGPVQRTANRLAAVEHRRIRRFHRVLAPVDTPAGTDPRALRHLAVRLPLGVAGLLVLVLLVTGLVLAAVLLWVWTTGTAGPLDAEEAAALRDGRVIAVYTVAGLLLLYLDLAGAVGIARGEVAVLTTVWRPDRVAALRAQVQGLRTSRAEVVAAVDQERRRIERDLHDGVAPQITALGLLLGRARHTADPDRRDDLLAQAHAQAGAAAGTLRAVSWRVYPADLDDAGLAAALRGVAERSAVPVRLTCDISTEPGPAVRTAAYFVVSEAVHNAVRHSGADEVRVRVTADDTAVLVLVEDSGCGGADPAGSGITGLARRVAAIDGRFRLHSPRGGPTVLEVRLPCA